jgi:hypothetical protein
MPPGRPQDYNDPYAPLPTFEERPRELPSVAPHMDPFTAPPEQEQPVNLPTPSLDMIAEMDRRERERERQEMAAGLERADRAAAEAGYPGSPITAEQLLRGADDLAMSAEDLRAMQGQRVRWSAPNPVYPATQRFTGEMLGEEGLLEQQAMAQQQVHDTRSLEASRMAETFDVKARALRDQAIDQKAREFERQRQLDEQHENQRQAMAAYDETAKQVREAQAYNPDQWWEDKSTGGKIGAIVAMVLGGIAFGPEMSFMIKEQMMGPELERQKETYRRAQEGLATRDQQFALQQSLYGQAMARVQDERQADLITESAMLEATLAEMEGYMAEAGVHVLNAEQQAFMTEIRQNIAQNRMQLEILSATTPKMVGGTAYALDQETRAAIGRQADREERREKMLEGLAGDVMKGEAVEMPKERRAQQFQMEQQARAQAAKATTSHSTLVGTPEADLSTAKGLLDLPNLRGVGVGGSVGAMSDPGEAQRVEKAVESLGLDVSDYTTEKGLRGAIKAKMELRLGEIRAHARRLSPEAFRQYYGREKPSDPARLDAFIDDFHSSPVRED